MQRSASPLLILMITVILALALGVHTVSASDPFYGSNIDFGIATPED